MAELEDDLMEALANWDGRHTAPLKECFRRNREEPGLADALLHRIGSTDIRVAEGSSWLLKAALETGTSLSPAQVSALIGILPALRGKNTILHVCQSVRHLTVDRTQADALVHHLERFLIDERPFLRAWSLDALAAVAARHPVFRERAAAALLQAREDPAASVRARARNLPGI